MREPAEIVTGPRKMSMPVEQKPTDSNKELGEIRREVIEARNLVIKTDNLLKNLHAEVKAVGSRQEDFQKRQWRSSAMAYALFAVLALGGAIFYASAKTASSGSERDRLEKTIADLTSQMDKLKTDSAANEQARHAAAEVYKLMTVPSGDERLKGVDALMKLDTARLSMLEKQALNDRAQLLRKEVGQQALERGKSAVRRNDMGTAVAELSRFVAMNPEQDDLLEASYYLGLSLNALKKHDQAAPYLARFVEGERKAKTREYAMLLLAQSYEQSGQLDKAAETAREAIGTYPMGEFNILLRNRLNSVKRLQSAGADSPAVQAALSQPAVGGVAPAPVPAAAKPGVAPAAVPAAARPVPAAPVVRPAAPVPAKPAAPAPAH